MCDKTKTTDESNSICISWNVEVQGLFSEVCILNHNKFCKRALVASRDFLYASVLSHSNKKNKLTDCHGFLFNNLDLKVPHENQRYDPVIMRKAFPK